jgi:acetylornithine deacetylase
MIDFLMDILRFDSTSGSENELAMYITEKYKPKNSILEIQETRNGRLNVFFKYGEPKIIFCSHLDTVPPYFISKENNDVISGRGSCDAKGQIAYLFEAFKQLQAEGFSDIGMLMVSGEEDGSQGAVKANETLSNCKYIIIGEPTENKLIKASKGNLLVNAIFKGKSCHSGYLQYGDSAVERMFEFFNRLKSINFEEDSVLGKTTYNPGKLESLNAQNVVSDLVKCKIFFRTTFSTDKILKKKLSEIIDNKTELDFVYWDEPMNFYILEGFETDVVSFGTDAPVFTNVRNKILYGPGSIQYAHTENEHIKIKDLYKAVEDVKLIYKKIVNEN